MAFRETSPLDDGRDLTTLLLSHLQSAFFPLAEERVFDFFLIAFAFTFLARHYNDGFPILKFLDKTYLQGVTQYTRCRKEVKNQKPVPEINFG